MVRMMVLFRFFFSYYDHRSTSIEAAHAASVRRLQALSLKLFNSREKKTKLSSVEFVPEFAPVFFPVLWLWLKRKAASVVAVAVAFFIIFVFIGILLVPPNARAARPSPRWRCHL